MRRREQETAARWWEAPELGSMWLAYCAKIEHNTTNYMERLPGYVSLASHYSEIDHYLTSAYSGME
jgi:hypothetical protein